MHQVKPQFKKMEDLRKRGRLLRREEQRFLQGVRQELAAQADEAAAANTPPDIPGAGHEEAMEVAAVAEARLKPRREQRPRSGRRPRSRPRPGSGLKWRPGRRQTTPLPPPYPFSILSSPSVFTPHPTPSLSVSPPPPPSSMTSLRGGWPPPCSLNLSNPEGSRDRGSCPWRHCFGEVDGDRGGLGDSYPGGPVMQGMPG
uniref:Branchpoint-bridging protein-like n=1 Tax=Geotrypetes seraphini TaxID=260995 RepID=A0A6P8NYH6_GEOSA|nr:branchpoint-bridging protein-like [Geotrypetes seraphini]XP_033773864.1 branchpoint-bridging protein-like [Geotrypetes seraphini]